MNEALIDFPREVPPVTAVRGSLLMLSLQSITEQGHRERYLRLLDPAYHDKVMNMIAASWAPMDVAEAHYAACEAANFSTAETSAIAEAVCRRMQGTYVETLARTARSVGATAWSALTRIDLLWKRLMLGGAVALTKVGPKDALAECEGLPLPTLPLFSLRVHQHGAHDSVPRWRKGRHRAHPGLAAVEVARRLPLLVGVTRGDRWTAWRRATLPTRAHQAEQQRRAIAPE